MHRLLVLVLSLAACACHSAASEASSANACVSVEDAADYVHTVIEADRATYANHVVHRLQDMEKVIKASESFDEDKALPLPAQMLRMGAKATAEAGQGKLRYALISQWAINKANLPKTDFEKQGMKALIADPSKPQRSFQEVGDKRYFMTMYPDKAVSEACINCHNNHEESPRSDFELGDVMGGIVVTMLVK